MGTWKRLCVGMSNSEVLMTCSSELRAACFELFSKMDACRVTRSAFTAISIGENTMSNSQVMTAKQAASESLARMQSFDTSLLPRERDLGAVINFSGAVT